MVLVFSIDIYIDMEWPPLSTPKTRQVLVEKLDEKGKKAYNDIFPRLPGETFINREKLNEFTTYIEKNTSDKINFMWQTNTADGNSIVSLIISHLLHMKIHKDINVLVVKLYHNKKDNSNPLTEFERKVREEAYNVDLMIIDDLDGQSDSFNNGYIPIHESKYVCLIDNNLINRGAMVKDISGPKVAGGGGKRRQTKYKKTSERITVDGRLHVVYEGPRGGKYIKRNQAYLSVRKLRVR
jgi:hypothetical protein